MEKFMTIPEIIKFIENMKRNSYFSLASRYLDEHNPKTAEAWWCVAKLDFGDCTNLMFDYHGGGYPHIYCIDYKSGESTIENALKNFMEDNPDEFDFKEAKYVVDTTIFHFGRGVDL